MSLLLVIVSIAAAVLLALDLWTAPKRQEPTPSTLKKGRAA
jgi:hypothetical protein